MLVNGLLHKAEHVIRLEDEDDDPEAIGAMLRFMYGLEYDSNPAHASTLLFHSQVYRVAAKYQVWRLKKDVMEKFETKARTSAWEADYFVSVLQNFPEETYEYDAGEEETFDCLVKICREHILDFDECDEFGDFCTDKIIFERDLFWKLAYHQKD